MAFVDDAAQTLKDGIELCDALDALDKLETAKKAAMEEWKEQIAAASARVSEIRARIRDGQLSLFDGAKARREVVDPETGEITEVSAS